MNTPLLGESSKELVTLAREHGYNVSMMQLARWHRAGLLRPPRQRPLGKGKGTQSVYPRGTGEQLLLLCAIHSHERRLAVIAWQLWWAGYPVSLHHIRDAIDAVIERLRRNITYIAELQALECDETEEAAESMQDFIEQVAEASLSYKPLRRIRKRVGRERFPTFVRMLCQIATGTFNEYGINYDSTEGKIERQILERGLGFRQGVSQNFHFSEDSLRRISVTLHAFLVSDSFGLVSDYELMHARDHVRTFIALSGCTSISDAILQEMEQVGGRFGQASLLILRIALKSVRPLPLPIAGLCI